jgi:hypothetical protein
VLDASSRHLYNSTRGAYTYALAATTFQAAARSCTGAADDDTSSSAAGSPPGAGEAAELAAACVDASRHGVRFLQEQHLQPQQGEPAVSILGSVHVD